MTVTLPEREKQIRETGNLPIAIICEQKSAAGAVSQRACVFCGSRVVLYPIYDALHLVHGPIGCAAYTWDIRGSVSPTGSINRLSFSTDLRERDIVYGGAEKLAHALSELITRYKPKAAFVYATCISGIIGDDIAGVCKKAGSAYGIPVIPVQSEGFRGTKKDGYAAACLALGKLLGTGCGIKTKLPAINLLGEFNLAGEAEIIRNYYSRMGIYTVAVMTGGAGVDDIRRAHCASLNIVQCSGSMMKLAQYMKETFGIPYIRASFFGIEDMSKALYDAAEFFKTEPALAEKTRALVSEEIAALLPQIEKYRHGLSGKKAAVYVGGGFKAISLVKALRHLGMKTVIAGSQTGSADDYRTLADVCGPGTIICDDSNPHELARFIAEKKPDVFIGGVKERPLAYKLGLGFCDHNHERKIGLAGFTGMRNFAEEVYRSCLSPVWKFHPHALIKTKADI